MSQPFLGEIRMGGWNFAPRGWAQCNGAQMQISQNEALFALLETTYGGDGITTFNLPDLQGRHPVHQAGSFVQGQKGGVETVTLTTPQIPSHNHAIFVSAVAGASSSPVNMAPAMSSNATAYNAAGNPTPMANLVGSYGGSQPHNNLMPFLCVTFVIALEGVFPSRN
jgi:microcystin-dependent protein